MRSCLPIGREPTMDELDMLAFGALLVSVGLVVVGGWLLRWGWGR